MLKIINTRNLFLKVVTSTIFASQSIQVKKQNYVNKITQKLGHPDTSSKCYGSLLKTLINGKKFICISPHFYVDEYTIDFQEIKWDFFNSLPVINVIRFQTEVSYLLNHYYRQEVHYPTFLSFYKRWHSSNNQ